METSPVAPSLTCYTGLHRQGGLECPTPNRQPNEVRERVRRGGCSLRLTRSLTSVAEASGARLASVIAGLVELARVGAAFRVN